LDNVLCLKRPSAVSRKRPRSDIALRALFGPATMETATSKSLSARQKSPARCRSNTCVGLRRSSARTRSRSGFDPSRDSLRSLPMRATTLGLVCLLIAVPALAQEQSSVRASMARAAASAAASAPSPPTRTGRGPTFWPGVALGVTGVTMAVLGTTAFRVEDSSTGNAPKGTYEACVAQQTNPIYAANQCDALKGKNLGLLWGGAALGAAGAVLIVKGIETNADLTRSRITVRRRFRL